MHNGHDYDSKLDDPDIFVSVFFIVTVDNVVFVVVVVLQQNTISTIKHNHEKKKPTVNLAST